VPEIILIVFIDDMETTVKHSFSQGVRIKLAVQSQILPYDVAIATVKFDGMLGIHDDGLIICGIDPGAQNGLRGRISDICLVPQKLAGRSFQSEGLLRYVSSQYEGIGGRSDGVYVTVATPLPFQGSIGRIRMDNGRRKIQMNIVEDLAVVRTKGKITTLETALSLHIPSRGREGLAQSKTSSAVRGRFFFIPLSSGEANK